MERLTNFVAALSKRVGYSSNHLLKCVLLNTAIELFGYDMSTIAFSYTYHDWKMEDFDHSYALPPDPRQHLQCSKVMSLPSDGNEQTDLQQKPSMSESAAHPSDKLENTSLSIKGFPHLHNSVDQQHVKADLDQNGTLHLVGHVNVWLELPVYCYEEMIALNTSAVPNYSILENDILMTTCGVETNEQSNINDSNVSFSFYEDSNFWDTYDFHIHYMDSNSLSDKYSPSPSSGFGSEGQAISDIEDWFMMDTPKYQEECVTSTPQTKSRAVESQEFMFCLC